MRRPVSKNGFRRQFNKARTRTRGENLAIMRGGWRL